MHVQIFSATCAYMELSKKRIKETCKSVIFFNKDNFQSVNLALKKWFNNIVEKSTIKIIKYMSKKENVIKKKQHFFSEWIE